MLDSAAKPRLCDLTSADLTRWCEAHGVPAYRAGQIRKWLFERRAGGFDEMLDLPAALRRQLADAFHFFETEVAAHRTARDRTEKLLLRLHDGRHVECVLMRETRRRTVCISTQVGCAMGCVFCASGMLGLERNLASGEILEQVLRIDRRLRPDERLTNVVVMGIGEPLHNLDELLKAVDTLSDSDGLALGARRITISTVGLPERMRRLAEHGKPYNLAVSLHAPNDVLRTQLVPINEKIGIAEILDAADEYFAKTGRRVTYEYVLLGGVNDAPVHARQLAVLLKNRIAHVNLIPMNNVPTLPYHQPTNPQTEQFVETLTQAGIPATVRKRKGADIDAACGQLRLQQEQPGNLVPLTAETPGHA